MFAEGMAVFIGIVVMIGIVICYLGWDKDVNNQIKRDNDRADAMLEEMRKSNELKERELDRKDSE